MAKKAHASSQSEKRKNERCRYFEAREKARDVGETETVRGEAGLGDRLFRHPRNDGDAVGRRSPGMDAGYRGCLSALSRR